MLSPMFRAARGGRGTGAAALAAVLAAVLAVVLAAALVPASAGPGWAAASDCYQQDPEYPQVLDRADRLRGTRGVDERERTRLLAAFDEIRAWNDAIYEGRHPDCAEVLALNRAVAQHDGEVAAQEGAVAAFGAEVAAYQSACATVTTESRLAACQGRYNALLGAEQAINAEKARLDRQAADLNRRGEAVNARTASEAAHYRDRMRRFIAGADAALAARRIFKAAHATAKSWIDGAAIAEFTLRGTLLKTFPNPRPTTPRPGGDDYKLYQTFVAEIVVQNGRIVEADWHGNSRDQRAGVTGGLPGEIRVLEETATIAADGRTATFLRTVEGNPNRVVFLADRIAPAPLHLGLRPIFNTIEVVMSATGDSRLSGRGSGFPSHTFFLGNTVVRELRQVQPSDYFR